MGVALQRRYYTCFELYLVFEDYSHKPGIYEHAVLQEIGHRPVLSLCAQISPHNNSGNITQDRLVDPHVVLPLLAA